MAWLLLCVACWSDGIGGRAASGLLGSDLLGADLLGADLRGADLRGGDLTGGDLTGGTISLLAAEPSELSGPAASPLASDLGGVSESPQPQPENGVEWLEETEVDDVTECLVAEACAFAWLAAPEVVTLPHAFDGKLADPSSGGSIRPRAPPQQS